jgi:MerR family transcriptional regulator, copper efflux regulator
VTFAELCALTGRAPRELRFLISEGFVPPPDGSRRTPDYGEAHATAVSQYFELREGGLMPAQIKALMSQNQMVGRKIWCQLETIPGLDVKVEQSILAGPDAEKIILAAVRAAVKKLKSP